jgi:MFS family permease
MQQVQHYPASQTGQLVIPLFLALMASSLLSGRLTDKIGARIPAVSGMIITIFSLYLLSLVKVDTSYLSLAAIMGILGLGIGATLPPMSKTIASSAPLPKIGAAVGAFNMVRNLGGPFGVAIAATLFANKVAIYAKNIFSEQIHGLGIDRTQLVGEKLAQLQDYAKIHGMQQAFSEISLIFLFVSVIGLVTASLVKAKTRSQEDLLKLQQLKINGEK